MQVGVTAGCRTCHAWEPIRCEGQVQCRPLDIVSVGEVRPGDLAEVLQRLHGFCSHGQ